MILSLLAAEPQICVSNVIMIRFFASIIYLEARHDFLALGFLYPAICNPSLFYQGVNVVNNPLLNSKQSSCTVSRSR